MIPRKDGTDKADFYIEKPGSETIKLTYQFTVENNKVTKYELLEKTPLSFE